MQALLNVKFLISDIYVEYSFPMELHMVFYKKQYRNVQLAMEKPDGLAVLAFFYHVRYSFYNEKIMNSLYFILLKRCI